jgi:hypothetical protein
MTTAASTRTIQPIKSAIRATCGAAFKGFSLNFVQHICHTRESGYPVRRSFAIDHRRFGILDHPLSRMMTARNIAATANGR